MRPGTCRHGNWSLVTWVATYNNTPTLLTHCWMLIRSRNVWRTRSDSSALCICVAAACRWCLTDQRTQSVNGPHMSFVANCGRERYANSSSRFDRRQALRTPLPFLTTRCHVTMHYGDLLLFSEVFGAICRQFIAYCQVGTKYRVPLNQKRNISNGENWIFPCPSRFSFHHLRSAIPYLFL